MKRVGVFVDMRNQYDSPSRKARRVIIDYELYLKECLSGRILYRAFAYGVYLNEEPRLFLGALKGFGYETNYRKADKNQFVDCNLMMTADIWRGIEQTDIVVIGSSDPALVPIVQRIRETGRVVEIFSLDISRELKEAANSYTEINLEKLGRNNASIENADGIRR